MRPSRYFTASAEMQLAHQHEKRRLLNRIEALSEALMCATDHLDFDSLAISHCTSLQKIQRGLASHAEWTGDEAAARRANWKP